MIMIDVTDIGPRYLQVYSNYDQFSAASDDYVKGEDHVCYVVTENEVIYWIALENVWRPLNVVTTSAGTIEGIDNPVNVTLRTVDGGILYTRVPNIPDAERIISMDNFLQNYSQIEYLDFTGNVNTTSMVSAFANSNIKDVGNLNFNKVTNFLSAFENCNNFDDGYTLTISSEEDTVDFRRAFYNSNVSNIVIDIPNVTDYNNVNLDMFTNVNSSVSKLKSNVTITDNIAFSEDFLLNNNTAKALKADVDYSDGVTYTIISPVYLQGYSGHDYTPFNLPQNITCEYILLNEFNSNEDTPIISIDTKQLEIICNSIRGNKIPNFASSYDIIFNQDNLQYVYINSISSNSVTINSIINNCGGHRIDFSEVTIKSNNLDNAYLPKGSVYSKDTITTQDIQNINCGNIVLPFYKDTDLTELANTDMTTAVDGKNIIFMLDEKMLPKNKSIEDKTKLGTHNLYNISRLYLDINDITNITIDNQYSEDNVLTLVIYDNTGIFHSTVDKTINIKSILDCYKGILLGSKVELNNSIFQLSNFSDSKYPLIVYTLGQGETENNTIFDDKYNYTIILDNYNYSSEVGADKTFTLNQTVFKGEYSIDKFSQFSQNLLGLNKTSTDNGFFWFKYKENTKVYINSVFGDYFIDNYWKYFDKTDSDNKPAIKVTVEDCFIYNVTNILAMENSEALKVMHTKPELSSLVNNEEYLSYFNNIKDLNIECIDGSITFDIAYETWDDQYYDYTYATSRRCSNIENIYGEGIKLSPKLVVISSDEYAHITRSLTRTHCDALQVSFDGNDIRQSHIKHIEITTAIKGYWDIRIAPNLDEETLNSLVENLEAWEEPPVNDTQDFNLYRSQWDLLSSEHQSMLSTKNYNVRITEDAPPQQITFYNGGVYVSYINWSIGGMFGSRSIRIVTNSINNGEFAPYTVAVQNTGGVDISSAFIITYETNLTGTTSMPYNSAFTIKYNGIENPSNVVWNAVATQTGTDFSQTLILNIS